jgi:Bacterial protein of unknown function (DUF885)
MRYTSSPILGLALLSLCIPGALQAQSAPTTDTTWAGDPPSLTALVTFARQESDLRVAVTRYVEDKAALERRYPVLYSPARIQRLRQFLEGWERRVAEVSFDKLNHEGQIDYLTLRNRVAYDLEQLRLMESRGVQMAPLLPFSGPIRTLQEERFDRKRVEPRVAAATLDSLATQVKALTEALNQESKKSGGGMVKRPGITPVIAARAAAQTTHLRNVLSDWNTFYDGYDPIYSWWSREPYGRANAALEEYRASLEVHLAGIKPGEPPPIIGDPVLIDTLRAELANEMIPYSPQELLEIAEREFAWIEDQFRIVARRMGFAEDWKAALEHTKNLAPPPGEKPWVIFDIARYSEEFIGKQDSVTMPPLAREIWRLVMQTPERQLINPFFSGGEVTHVSYPTDTMSLPDKLMSMRGNTPHFNFATVHHELIPGHHLQRFMGDRFNPHRANLNDTPFWREGWALYWELSLWDADFPRNDPDRIGMLFWRLHRAARIIFSLNFQLGRWTPQQCVDFLVDRVGHERANAAAEVRRSAQAVPLYQAAYLLGGLQFRALYKELVGSGRMNARAFHDAVLQGGSLPVELVRARLTDQPLTRDFRSQWRFYDGLRTP